MGAAINIQNVTRDCRGVGQVHDRIGDVLDLRRPTHGRQTFDHVLPGLGALAFRPLDWTLSLSMELARPQPPIVLSNRTVCYG